jgi:hypothetical protein
MWPIAPRPAAVATLEEVQRYQFKLTEISPLVISVLLAKHACFAE